VSRGKVFEKTLPHGRVLGILPLGGPNGTVPELMFEKKELINKIQQILCFQM
jgi:hypothetical protein